MRELKDILEEYENIREAFRHFSLNGNGNKETIMNFQQKFLDLKADLRPWHVQTLRRSENRSEKAATAIKMRIAISMIKGEYEFKEGEKPMYEKLPTISSADKFAAATKEYKEFLDQRTFHRESFVNIADLREDLQGYINITKDRLKYSNNNN